MKTIIVDQGQSLLDIAIQHAGTVSELSNIAKANGLSVTDDLIPSSTLIIPNVSDAQLVQFFSDYGYVPASGLSPEDQQAIRGGISYMGIVRNFKVGD